MRSYLVRIYRTAEKDQRIIVGVVEKAGEAVKQAFTQYDELWEILTGPDRPGPYETGKTPKEKGSPVRHWRSRNAITIGKNR
jgi:hypothetical protein